MKTHLSLTIASCILFCWITSGSKPSLANGHYSVGVTSTVTSIADTLKVKSVIEGINTSERGRITLHYRLDTSSGKGVQISKKLIIANGKIFEPGKIGGIENADYFLLLDGAEAVKKYGLKGENGVIEALGVNLKILNLPTPPPDGPPPSDM
ncbi:hypothetical protein [Pedobacter aquatilis]|uniref:hypothetical protein n=1 Tax=Pedobacter aquatilis TaxID=351343 RepID=UPI00292CCB36|nr:hypothetical protein [Pedobacter aquatilis]